jgi:hypothetical protein
MLRLLLTIVVLHFLALSPLAQTRAGNSPSEWLLLLQKSKPDTNRIKLLLQLGKHHLFKRGEYKNDLDSAFSFLLQAKYNPKPPVFSDFKKSSSEIFGAARIAYLTFPFIFFSVTTSFSLLWQQVIIIFLFQNISGM